MRIGEWEVNAHRAFRRFGYDVYIYRRLGDKVEVMKPDLLTVYKVDQDAEFKEPTMKIDDSIMDVLFNALWDIGLRPKDRKCDNQMSLIKNHLQDMRRLVFKDKL